MDTSEKSARLDFDYWHSLEYVEANGLGGYASGTFSGAHSRKYHGVLVAALNPPVDRAVVVSKLDESLIIGDQVFDLSSNQFPGALHPHGYQYITGISKDLFPQWEYKVKGVTIRKTIASVYQENTTLILYEFLDAPDKFTFQLQPYYACRNIHHLSQANSYFGLPYVFDKGIFQTMNYQRCPEFFISIPRSTFIEGRSWSHNFEYQQEYLRGMEFREDLYTHGKFSVSLRRGNRLGVIVSLENPVGKDAFKLFREEKKRRERLVKDINDELAAALVLAADQFIVKRGEGNTIIAGYPWFADWGRDTMISIPGLCLATGRVNEAKKILQKYAEYISDGMIPNRFPDSNEKPEYNTIDATLWFFNAVYKYYQHTRDKLFIKVLVPLLREIIDWHYKGTRFNIKVDPDDELLSGGEQGCQLTWMDAKIGDWVVTPRMGKPVEVNALWYNALKIMEFFLAELSYHEDAELFEVKSERVKDHFNLLFWNPKAQCLYDVIGKDYRSDEIRPNQLYAVGLPFPIVSPERATQIVNVVRKELVTSKGLRSLAPSHPDYQGIYQGDPLSRDSHYHQGTVWSHLAGIYIDSLFVAIGEEGRAEASRYLRQILQNLNEAGLGTISEIFDGDKPHLPRGCFAQAWSVGELLRVAYEHNLLDFQKGSSRLSPFASGNVASM